jgi:hypothetical protein
MPEAAPTPRCLGARGVAWRAPRPTRRDDRACSWSAASARPAPRPCGPRPGKRRLYSGMSRSRLHQACTRAAGLPWPPPWNSTSPSIPSPANPFGIFPRPPKNYPHRPLLFLVRRLTGARAPALAAVGSRGPTCRPPFLPQPSTQIESW